MLERRFGRFKSNKTNTPESQCEAHLNEFRSMFYDELMKELKDDEDLSINADCLIQKSKEFHIAEISMKKLVYENTERMTKRKRKKAIKSIDYAIEKKMETAVKLCTSSEVFGELFDTLFDGSNDNETDSTESTGEDYCLRKYIVDNNFINTTVYQVNLNPDNIDVSKLNCDEVVKQLREEHEEEINEEFKLEFKRPSKRVRRCLTKTFRTHNYFESTIRVFMLGEMNISDEQKTAERNSFIESMQNFYADILKC